MPPISSPQELLEEFKKSGEFDRLRREMFTRFQAEEDIKDTLMRRVDHITADKLGEDAKSSSFKSVEALEAELIQEVDRYPIVERAVISLPLFRDDVFLGAIDNSLRKLARGEYIHTPPPPPQPSLPAPPPPPPPSGPPPPHNFIHQQQHKIPPMYFPPWHMPPHPPGMALPPPNVPMLHSLKPPLQMPPFPPTQLAANGVAPPFMPPFPPTTIALRPTPPAPRPPIKKEDDGSDMSMDEDD